MVVLALLGLQTLILAVAAGAEGDAQADKVSAGQRLYREGISSSGEAVTGFTHGDIPISASQLACESCHRRSGLGSSEGGKVVPPVTGQALFQDREHEQQAPFRSRSMSVGGRPAYELSSLADALRLGGDSGANELDPLMPRYDMSDSDVEALYAYLETLASELPAGVDDSKVHLATIAAKNADESERESMLEILKAFAADKNADTRNESGRSVRGPYFRAYMDVSYRKWDLHVWELEGPSETWFEQLEALYEEQPVFAFVSGIGEGSWRPVHDFCAVQEVPCIFPITDRPVLDEDFYSIYLNGGVYREAKAVAEHLYDKLSEEPALVLQVYRAGSAGEAMAGAFLKAAEDSSATIEAVRVAGSAAPPSANFWETLYRERGPGIVLAWLGPDDLKNLGSGAGVGPATPSLVILSDTLSGDGAYSVTGPIRQQVRVVSLLELPERRERGLLRLRTWVKPRGIEINHPRVQADAFLAATLAGSAVKHMRRNFSREYMIEIVEHGLDNSVFRSVYPQLTLGPNQRLASKSAYILRPSPDAEDGWVAVDAASSY